MARYTAIFEQAPDGGWGGYFPDIPNLYVNGQSMSEVRANAHSGLAFWMETAREEGLPIPPPSALVEQVEVAA